MKTKPEISKSIGTILLCSLNVPSSDHVPKTIDRTIIATSTQAFARNSNPKRGKPVATNGNAAQ